MCRWIILLITYPSISTSIKYVFLSCTPKIQPANMYVERGRRIEEGVLILSLYPIVSQEYILLSRDPNDPQDDHQRLVFRAGIEVCAILSTRMGIDKRLWHGLCLWYSSFSFGACSRSVCPFSCQKMCRTVQEIYNYISTFDPENEHQHILCGDLNAEPDSDAIRYLQVCVLRSVDRQGFIPMNNVYTDFKDAWLQLFPEPVPRTDNEDQRYNALTFPTDNPVKRIDFVLYRSHHLFVCSLSHC